VRLVSLYARNFKKLKLDEPISFPEGITLISGLNESGKSTILDAILYALFGRVVRPRMVPRNEDILAYGTDKATVTLRFSIDKRTFAVRREVFRSSPNNRRHHLQRDRSQQRRRPKRSQPPNRTEQTGA